MYYSYSEIDYRQMLFEIGWPIPEGKPLVKCPFHTDKTPSMSISLKKGVYHCFSCNASGSISKLYYDKTGHSYKPTTHFNSDQVGLYVRNVYKPHKEVVKWFKPQFESIPESSILRNWLNYRGISDIIAKAAGVTYGNVNITYNDDDDEQHVYSVHDRVMLPVYDSDNKLISIEMRFPFNGTENARFKERVKKVLYPKNSSVNTLYEFSKLDKTKKLYVLEGMMDCLAFRSLTSIGNSTSIFGACLTNKQASMLNLFPEVCYVYNQDEAGSASLATMKAKYKGKLTCLEPVTGCNDVGDMAKAKVKEIGPWLQTEHPV